MYLDYFTSAFYINRDCRTDRKELFEQRSSKVGLSIPRFKAVEMDISDSRIPESLRVHSRVNFKIGCNLSHFSIVNKAIENNWENVLIFEDDCVFENEFSEKINVCVNELRKQEWDIFYMGGEPNHACLPLTENLRLCSDNGGVYGTHAYALNKRFYNKILKCNPFQGASIDVIYMHMYPRKYVITKELLATQDDTESDLWGGVIKRKTQYKETYEKYIK